MARLVLPAEDLKEIIRRRRRRGADRRDEVWNGVYVMSPDPNIEHQAVQTQLTVAVFLAVNSEDVVVLGGTNVSDDPEKWTKNYRCPDVAVFLPGNPAENRKTHWLGGPDFAVEVVSPKDRSRKKLGFYAKVGVRELLIVDRAPWRLELYRNDGERLALLGALDCGSGGVITSQVLPLSFSLTDALPRPRIEIRHTEDGRTWSA